jgi:hypothetical protein
MRSSSVGVARGDLWHRAAPHPSTSSLFFELEVEILKEALAAARAKKIAVALAVAPCEGSPMKTVNLVEQAKRGGSRPRPPYRKAGDAELLARIRPWSTPGRATATGGLLCL